MLWKRSIRQSAIVSKRWQEQFDREHSQSFLGQELKRTKPVTRVEGSSLWPVLLVVLFCLGLFFGLAYAGWGWTGVVVAVMFYLLVTK
jgi:hypothetical protein